MSDRDLFDAVAHKTGEDSREIARRGFSLTGRDDAGPEPQDLLDMLLVDLQETGTVGWGSLGFGCREPLFTRDLKARRRKTSVKVCPKTHVARAALPAADRLGDRNPIKRRAWSVAEVPKPPSTRAGCFSHSPTPAPSVWLLLGRGV